MAPAGARTAFPQDAASPAGDAEGRRTGDCAAAGPENHRTRATFCVAVLQSLIRSHRKSSLDPCIGVAIRTTDLVGSSRTERLTQSQPVTLREVNADLLLAHAPEPARALSAIVTLRLLDGHTDIDGAARMAQMSVQSLQRRLREKGFTYREIVGLARQRRAESLLAETEMRIVDIALALGYEEHANFTRAFKAAAGVSPADFRCACRQSIGAHTRPKRQLPG